jgi:hypothetical protein
MEITYGNGAFRYDANDDANPWRLCSRIIPIYPISWGCENVQLNLGCFGTSTCGGSVEVTIGTACPSGTFSKNGFTPCLPCPAGLNSTSGERQCTRCADGYIGFNGTAPCVPCPANTIEVNHDTCEICNPDTLHTMYGDLYDKCLMQILYRASSVEERFDVLADAFQQYLVDINHGMPTVHPTMMPTRRRRSRAPVSGSHHGM